ncbi:MAG TPA: ATP-binding protein [Blastocatellia bacterium]
MLSFFLNRNRRQLLLWAAGLIAGVALIDWRVDLNVAFGFLYLFPMLIVGNCLPRSAIVLVAALCTFLAECFGPPGWNPSAGIPRDMFVFTAYLGAGLFAYESTKNRQLTQQHVGEIEQEVVLRRDAEQQLKVLIESSPAAIVTLDAEGKILMANQAAHRLLGFEKDELPGRSIAAFLPPLAAVPPADDATPSFRTVMQCRGRRQDGEVFLADVWFSTYQTSSGPRLAAMLVDSSDNLRDREEFSLHQLLAGSRLVVGAVSHEIRNICGAISVLYANLSRVAGARDNEDLRALGSLVEGLEKVATLELRQSAGNQEPTSVDLYSVFDELRIVTEPALRESGVSIHWDLPDGLPRVWADRHNLLQVLMNLTNNSERAMQDQDSKDLYISASAIEDKVIVRIRDTGCGLSNPDRLFQPFQYGAEATGLGLYLSRAFVRSFKGDLQYEPVSIGCCFALELAQYNEQEAPQVDEQDQGLDTGRPHVVSRRTMPAA